MFKLQDNDKHPRSFLGKEVFIVTDGLSKTLATENFHIFENVADVQEYLLTVEDLTSVNDLNVIHGFITSAMTLPDHDEACDIFILIDYGTHPFEFEVEEFVGYDQKDLIGEIQRITRTPKAYNICAEVDEIFIIYGYSIDLSLTIDIDKVDEDKLLRAGKMTKRAKALKEIK